MGTLNSKSVPDLLKDKTMKTKTRKNSVKRLIDKDGNVKAMIYIEIAQNKDSVTIGFKSRYSIEAADSRAARSGTDLWHYCESVPHDSRVINNQKIDMGYFRNFLEHATHEERKTLAASKKFPFGFYCGTFIKADSFPRGFLDVYDEADGTYRYESELLLDIAKEKNWTVK